MGLQKRGLASTVVSRAASPTTSIIVQATRVIVLRTVSALLYDRTTKMPRTTHQRVHSERRSEKMPFVLFLSEGAEKVAW